MFMVRSAFWLSIAFTVIAPVAGTDAGSVARTTGEQLAHRGAEAAASTLAPESCTAVECVVGRALIANAVPAPLPAAAPAPQAVEQEPVLHAMAPIPPRRPDWAY